MTQNTRGGQGNGSERPSNAPKESEPIWYKNTGQPDSPDPGRQISRPGDVRGLPAHSRQQTTDGTDDKRNPMLNKTVVLGNDSYTIKGQFTCGGRRLFALEANKPMTGYTGRCPACLEEHVPLVHGRGYYAAADSVYDALEKRELEQQRSDGRATTERLPSVKDHLPPLDQPLIGRNKGIEGDSNSCYMDATLFCMFTYSNVFDSLLHMKVDDRLAPLQARLRDNVVHVLRSPNGFVTRDAMYHLRDGLSEATKDPSFREMEKDPSEFLRALEQLFHFAPIKTLPPDQPPKLDHSNVTSNILWEMFDANAHNLRWINIATIFRNSLAEIPAKLASIPPFLILIAPRHRRSERSYRYIVPDRQIVLDNHLLQLVCYQCGKTNHQKDTARDFFYCNQCCSSPPTPASPDASIHCLCGGCLNEKHTKSRSKELLEHKAKQINTGRHKLNLFAVLCIETSHYVAFVKCHKRNHEDEWIFFDSMSDRVHNDKNISCVSRVPDFDLWLAEAEKGGERFFNVIDTRRAGPGPMSQRFNEDELRQLRLFRDGAFFFYENSTVNYQ